VVVRSRNPLALTLLLAAVIDGVGTLTSLTASLSRYPRNLTVTQGAAVAVAVAVLVAGCSGTKDRRLLRRLTATVACRGTAAVVRFDPRGEIEVLRGTKTVAWANARGRGLAFAACPQVATQRGWRTIPYSLTKKTTTVTCRFPRGFFVHVHPVYSSQSGEFVPDGSAVYVVVGKQRKMAASATVMQRASESAFAYSRPYCS
jgi:hypothetical protein